MEEAKVAHGPGGGADVKRITRVREDDAQVIELGWGGQGTDSILRRDAEKGEYNSVERWQNERRWRGGARRNGGRGEGTMQASTGRGRGHGFRGLGMILGNGWLDFGVIGVLGMLAGLALAT